MYFVCYNATYNISTSRFIVENVCCVAFLQDLYAGKRSLLSAWYLKLLDYTPLQLQNDTVYTGQTVFTLKNVVHLRFKNNENYRWHYYPILCFL